LEEGENGTTYVRVVDGKEEKETKKNFYQKEQHYGAFQKSVSLPRRLLKITFPKTASADKKIKKTEIQ
jgi:HSP20 family molecular chaperone IbpA